MLEMSGEIHNGQKFTFCVGLLALSFAERFGCVTNDAFGTFLNLSENGTHCMLASFRIKHERFSHAREGQDWGGSESRLQNFKCFRGFGTPKEILWVLGQLMEGTGYFCKVLQKSSIVWTEAYETFDFGSFLWYWCLLTVEVFSRSAWMPSRLTIRPKKGTFWRKNSHLVGLILILASLNLWKTSPRRSKCSSIVRKKTIQTSK